MSYINAKEAAEKWNICVRGVQILCKQGKIRGAERLGNIWAIPKDAEKPLDGRTRKVKIQKQQLK